VPSYTLQGAAAVTQAAVASVVSGHVYELTNYLTAARWDFQLLDTNTSGAATVSSGYNLAATSADAFYLELSTAANFANSLAASSVALSVGDVAADVKSCSDPMAPYLDVTNGSTGSAVETADACVAFCPQGS